MEYDANFIEKKWKEIWGSGDLGVFADDSKKKFYCLDMFPYPSGSGLHVGHWRGYVFSDVYARMKWLQGFNVLHPMGWDAFGLPAENDAIKKGIHPEIGTRGNIANFKNQLKQVGAFYDWSKEINTTDPGYYKWTQWIFLKMFEAGLAYQSDYPINWCPSCLTGLANEEVVNGGCERCSAKVESKKIRQWVLKITNYADRLLKDLEKLDWPDRVKSMQRNWIGKNEGIEVLFKVEGPLKTLDLTVYTTRPDTIYGVSFLALAPDHDLVPDLTFTDRQEEILSFQKEASIKKSPGDRSVISGVFTGSYASHPLTGEKVPVYLSNFVLKDYATGAVMGVPAHDSRDFEFGKISGLPIKQVIESPKAKLDLDGDLIEAYEGTGVLKDSGEFTGLDSLASIVLISKRLSDMGISKSKVAYRLRDWVFSRQRYWGEPIPLVHCKQCGVVSVPEQELPILLPEVEKYQPTGTGESPLANVPDWLNVKCYSCGGPARRETNTMPQWAGSCWYFLRYLDPTLKDKPFLSKDVKYWMPVDLYVGGVEHAVLHLLYARFYIKVLYDLGYLPFDEPFSKLFNQGMICKHSEKSGLVEKMSKSKGNVVNPDEIVKNFGADTLRLYVLFIGPPELDCEWQDSGIEGCSRFLSRFWDYMTDSENITWDENAEDISVKRRVHVLVKDVVDRLAAFKTNTLVSAFMEWLNEAIKTKACFSADSFEKILTMFSILAPHISCEIISRVLKKNLEDCKWPSYDPNLVVPDAVKIIVQVNGKFRGNIEVSKHISRDDIEVQAKNLVSKWLSGKDLVKVIFVPGKLINFVIS